jgi:imidazolonepropionase
MKPDQWMMVRGARQLLTLHRNCGARRGPDLNELGVIPDGSILLRNGVVDAVGPTRRIENMANAKHADVFDASGRVAMPAFVDPHTCIVPAPACRKEASRVIQALPASRLEAQTEDVLKLMARHGTATIGSLSGFGGDASGELKILRVLHAQWGKPLDLVSILLLAEGAEEGGPAYEMLSCVARRKLVRVAALRCGEGAIPLAAAEPLMHAVRSHGMALRVEMSPVREFQLVETAVNQGALSVSVAGPYRVPEMEMLSDATTFVILTPEMHLRNGLGNSVRELITRGARVALGSGLSPEGGSASMQEVVQLAVEVLGMTLAEAISAATINAAWSLGAGAYAGSLEHGKSGDVILLNASDYHEIPMMTGTNLTYAMIKHGTVLFKEDFPGWPTPE